jgi:hypothetical protein
MDKRRLALSLGLVGLGFLALFHTVLALAFDTGLGRLGVGVLVLVGVGLLVVNRPRGEPDS